MAAKAKKKTPAGNRYASQVDAESTLKFGPQQASLAQQLKDAGKQYDSDVSVAQGTAEAIQQAAKTAKPKLTGDYKTALSTVDDTKTSLAADLAKLPSAGAIAGASARDAAGTTRRLSEALAASKAETDSRARDATSGEAYAISNARTKLSDTREKVADAGTELSREQGAFAQGRSGELVEAARGRSVTRRGQDKTADTAADNRKSADDRAQATLDETTRHNKETENNTRNAAKNKAGADPKQTEKFGTSLARAREQVKRVMGEVSDKDKASGKVQRSRSETAGILVNGRPGQKIENAPKDGVYGGQKLKAGDPLPNPIVVPDVKQTDQLAASVALDLAYDGHLSTANLKRLHALKISVHDLGISTAGRSGTKASKAKPGVPLLPKPAPLPSGASALGRSNSLVPVP